ncbi:hypothetical protein Ancab_007292 [Ancistrocladus abbreviatus]
MGGSRVLWRTIGKRYSSLPAALSSISAAKYPGLKHPDIWVRGSNNGSSTSSQPSSTSQTNARTAAVINGKSIAACIKSQIASEIHRMKDAIGKHPGLAVVLLGDKIDSHSFVRIKMKACDGVGIASLTKELPGNCTEDEVLKVISSLNEDPSVHGIIIQLPVPEHLDEEKIWSVVSPEKDVDGFHPLNMGNLAMQGREPFFIPCAAKGCVELLLRSGVEIAGKNVVVIGQRKIVGLPISLLLQEPNGKLGFHLTGDVCYEEAVEVASAITPVPGGLGPVTISMLLSNTLDSAKRAYGFV